MSGPEEAAGSDGRNGAPGGAGTDPEQGGTLTRLATVERQAGALAWLPGEPVRFVLVTSRRTRRWVFPKGGIEDGHTAPETAAREAFEEAGVIGRAAPEPVGSFLSEKIRLPHVWTLEVEIFPLAVEEVRDDWPEAGQRDRRFVTLAEARALLSDPAMVAIVERFSAARD